MDKFSYISNAEGDYIEDLYTSYQENPNQLDESWRRFFEGFEFSVNFPQKAPAANGQSASSTGGGNALKELQVYALIRAYRSRAHLLSDTNPVRKRRDRKPRLALSDYNLTDADLQTKFIAGREIDLEGATLEKILAKLDKIYSGYIGFEFAYIREPEMRKWIEKKIESEWPTFDPTIDEKKRILSKLNEAVVFENFLHTKYIGQKRFSLEGGETTIVALDEIINSAADLGMEEVVIGMAHRGRLNVLANIMGKTYEHIFSEFEGTAIPDMTMGDGDVKYHMGYSSEMTTRSGKTVNLKLTPNPSHLEAVNPVVEGYTRAKIDGLYEDDEDKALPILIHGDAAIAGQGVGYEVVQMSRLEGYHTGGTIHFVINNQVGFTTDFDDARSSIYCTDVAKTIDAPVLHVNGDRPEAVVFAVRFAVEFRQKFNQDIFIDMVCYRRHGHNESDEPKFTQPTLYNKIAKHANPREVYNQKLVESNEVNAELAKSMDEEFRTAARRPPQLGEAEAVALHLSKIRKRLAGTPAGHRQRL